MEKLYCEYCGKTLPCCLAEAQNPSQEEFNKFFREFLNKYKNNVRFESYTLSFKGYHRYEIFDEDGNWLFDVNYDPENPHFLFSYDRVEDLFREHFNIEYVELQEYMKDVVDKDFKLKGVTPALFRQLFDVSLEEDFKLREVTPDY